MDSHSLVLLSGSTLDTCHPSAQSRRIQPLPLRGGPRRPLKNIAQGLARLLPHLRQLSQRLRRVPISPESGVPVQTCSPASDADAPSTSGPACTVAPSCSHHNWDGRRRVGRRAQRTQLQQQQHVHRYRARKQGEEKSLQQQEHAQEEEGCQQVPPRHPCVERRYGPLRRLRRALHLLEKQLRPMGAGHHDKRTSERILNVATCGMFFQAGVKIIRLCQSAAARRFGWAFVAVGVIASVYHGSWGRFRPLARKADYYSIALSSLLLRSAAIGPVPRWLSAAMLLAIPFKPTLISSSNFMAVEVRYLLLALSQRQLMAEWATHMGLSVAATMCFTLDSTPLLAWCPFAHASFHALSAAAFLTLPTALNHMSGALPAGHAAAGG